MADEESDGFAQLPGGDQIGTAAGDGEAGASADDGGLPPKPPTAEATDNEPGSAPDPDSSLVTRRPEPESGGGSGATFAPASAGATGPCDAFWSLPDEAEPAVGAPCGCNRDQDGREVSLMVWQSVDPHVCVDA